MSMSVIQSRWRQRHPPREPNSAQHIPPIALHEQQQQQQPQGRGGGVDVGVGASFAIDIDVEVAGDTTHKTSDAGVIDGCDSISSSSSSSQGSKARDGDPPPPYSEGLSPLRSFTYTMAAAGGAASILTQVQQVSSGLVAPEGSLELVPELRADLWVVWRERTGIEPPGDEQLLLDLRGTRFTLTRDELLTLPEFILLSLFPTGGLPESNFIGPTEQEVHPVD
ncbi:hypothetical protein KEM52_002002, partial [Ascosphaera acerosa]